LLIGDSCLDKYHYGECSRLSPEAPVPVFKLLYTEIKPGMLLNVESNLVAQGHEVYTKTNKTELITKERFIEIKSKNQLLRLDTGETKKLNSIDISSIDIKKYDCVALSDYDKGLLSYKVCLQIAKQCKENNVPLYVDSKKEDLSCFEESIIKINEKERNNAVNFPEKCDIIITLGEKGALWRDKIYKAEKTEVFDVCGAGDTFFAAFITEHLKTGDFAKSLVFANKCAALTVKKIGAYCPTDEQIKEVRDGIRI
jgi:D-beta-D-heptose 7-phosphate kinase/D-beta-D-heptose 1-phosphate adenosyltransferase